MALRAIGTGKSLPWSFPIHLSATFQPGMIGQLTLQGNAPVLTVSDGTAPLGIIDDVRTKAFTAPSIDETIIISVPGTQIGGQWVSAIEVKYELDNPNILPDTFISTVSCALKPRNGVVVFPQGTPLNIDLDGDGTPDGIKSSVRYLFEINNLIGEDTTSGSGRANLFYERGIFQTDIFDTTATYPLNANLFVSPKGLLTTKQTAPGYPSCALVLASANSVWPWLEFLWL